MQREALLTNAAMAITKLTNETNEVLHITHSKFGCGSAALGYLSLPGTGATFSAGRGTSLSFSKSAAEGTQAY